MMGAWAAGGTGELGAMGALGGLGERTPGPVSRGIEEQWVKPPVWTPPGHTAPAMAGVDIGIDEKWLRETREEHVGRGATSSQGRQEELAQLRLAVLL